MTLEDCHATAGVRSTWGGFVPLRDHIPTADSTAARRLLAAGAILLGKTNGPAIWGEDGLFSHANNPWNSAYSPGGSAAGPAAAVAAGLSAFDVGLDTTGSVQWPAHCCGIYGMRPTEHRVPLSGAFFIDPVRKFRILSVTGPMARSIQDLQLILPILAGPDGDDTHVPPVPWRPVEAPLEAARVALATQLPGILIDDQISAAIEELARRVAGAGGTVAEALPAIDFVAQHELADALFARVAGAFSEGDTPPAESTLDAYFSALGQRDAFIQAWERFFSTWDVLLCPAFGCTATAHDAPAPIVNGVALAPDNQFRPFLPSANGPISGCPVIVMPLGHDTQGMPFGVQLVGRRWDDERLLAIATRLSALTDGFQTPPLP